MSKLVAHGSPSSGCDRATGLVIERAMVDRDAAAALVSRHEGAERIVRDPAVRDSLPNEIEVYFSWSQDFIRGEVGQMPDTTREVFAEPGRVLVAIRSGGDR